VVSDEHAIKLPADLPSDEYTVIVGIYDAATGKRLAVAGGGDFVALESIGVAGAGER
jgi:hypothetical protein